MGDLKSLRIGYPPNTSNARLALDVPSGDFNITGLSVEKGQVTATISRGIQASRFNVAPDAAAELRTREALARRTNTTMASSKLPGRGGLDDPNVLRPDPGIPTIPDNPDPEVGLPSRFNPVGSLAGHTVIVDAGHGGHHAGATGLNYLEKELCLKMAFELQRSLEAKGARVIMTRTSDLFVSLDDRCRIANQSGGEIFISIHCNSMPRRNMQSGSESYWHSSEQSRRLARALHPRLVASVRGRDGGIRNRSFQVIRETSMPSVLLEIAYINNTQDEILLSDADFHHRLAENLTKGVMDYFGKDAQ
jgi:N-acetylmuramoyl-L-alanine amidase